jgi:peptide methionine sulfoxide reductase MsrB
MVRALLPKIAKFGVSDKLNTIKSEYSWVLSAPKFTTSARTKSSTYWGVTKSKNKIFRSLARVFNGKTPSGKAWNASYTGGYVWINGRLSTFGKWNKFYEGCGWKNYYNVGQVISLRTGGDISHAQEYIHTACNGYATKDHSITSRFEWDNTRVFWVQLKK